MTTWTWRTSPTTNWGARTDINFLLLEIWDFLLQETWDFFLLEDSYGINTTWNTRPTIA
jgi:hypothetical protein